MAGINNFTKLLCHFNGKDLSTLMYDSSPIERTITPYGNAIKSATKKKFGATSLFLDGTGDYISIADSNDWNFGTGDFTIDFWFLFYSLPVEDYAIIVAQREDANNKSLLYFDTRTSEGNRGLRFQCLSASSLIVNLQEAEGNGSDYVINTWYHVAIVRNGSNWTMYLDGTTVATLSSSVTYPDFSAPLLIGGEPTEGKYLYGYIDEFRIQKGEAIWLTDFTSPTEEYTLSINDAMKLLCHFDGDDESVDIIDNSYFHKTISVYGNAQLDTSQYKFESASLQLDGTGDYLTLVDSPDFDFQTENFTIDFWVRFNSLSANYYSFLEKFDAIDNGWAFWYNRLANQLWLYSSWSAYAAVSWTASINTWYHIAVVRNGDEILFFVDGVQQGSSGVAAETYNGNNGVLYIGYGIGGANAIDGRIDELRILRGIAAWTSNFTPPVIEYVGDESGEVIEDETLTFSENVNISEILKAFEESLSISEVLEINQSLEKINQTAILNIIENSVIVEILKYITVNESLSISENANIYSTGLIQKSFNTDLRTSIDKSIQYMTCLITSILSFNKYNTKLITKVMDTNSIFNTDLRIRYDEYDFVNIGSLNDFIVKLDGVELTDVDYKTLRIKYTLNSNPSSATFILARRHDNFNYKLDGIYSQIDNENKIEIYDNTLKIFTGYITGIKGISQNDTVQIVAEDNRYKLSRTSLEIWYGGIWKEEEVKKYHNAPKNDWVLYQRSIGEALQIVFSNITPYVSSINTIPFPTSYVPEYVETESTLSDLLTTLVTQTANANWYLDENEVLCFQQVERGTIKSIPLSSLNNHRHVYDAIISDISLNYQRASYAKCLVVKLGTHIIRKWARRHFEGWLDSYVEFVRTLIESISFCFQQWGNLGQKWYCGVNTIIYGYVTEEGWVLKPSIDVQYQIEDSDEELPDIIVGSGLPTRTLHLNSYGIKEVSNRWEEQLNPNDDDKPWLVSVTEESYDYTDYALDMANFELSQNNKLQTTATISLLFDAFKYYNLSFENQINIINTIGTNIYNNNNGFPLNIDNIEIDCSTRITTLNLTNYGKSYYVKTKNYIASYVPLSVHYLYVKDIVVEYSQGV